MYNDRLKWKINIFISYENPKPAWLTVYTCKQNERKTQSTFYRIKRQQAGISKNKQAKHISPYALHSPTVYIVIKRSKRKLTLLCKWAPLYSYNMTCMWTELREKSKFFVMLDERANKRVCLLEMKVGAFLHFNLKP